MAVTVAGNDDRLLLMALTTISVRVRRERLWNV